jgi:hypothetical protein
MSRIIVVYRFVLGPAIVPDGHQLLQNTLPIRPGQKRWQFQVTPPGPEGRAGRPNGESRAPCGALNGIPGAAFPECLWHALKPSIAKFSQ